ncbi:MAG: hypothetical protein HQL23_07170 [Candidatus Omnitrophica bacterium]|nr:hypothetical protein [Candidatus Omnitrophota bacterium]
MMNKTLGWLLIGLAFCGCAKLQYLPELLTLKDLSESKARTTLYIDSQNQKFANMLAAAKRGELKQYHTKKEFQTAFGDPVMTRSIQRGGKILTECLYRRQTDYFARDKIYLYFDKEDRLVDTQF